MASVFDVPALQTPDIGGNFLSAYQTGQDRAVVNQRRLSQVAAGQAAARGDLSGAANTAYGAGDLATGQAFANMDQAQKDKINTLLGQGADLADTPEKWAQFTAIVQKQLGVPIKATFADRDAIRALYGPKPEPMSVSPGDVIINKNNPAGGALFTAPASNKPMSEAGKIAADVKAGLIPPQPTQPELPVVPLTDEGKADPVAQQQFLDSLDPSTAALVKGIANYQMDISKVTSLRGDQRKHVAELVTQYDPSFDMTQYPARAAMQKSITSGNYSMSLNAANLVIQHLDQLATAHVGLNNSSYPAINFLGNKGLEATGSGRITAFNNAKDAVASELAKVFKGTGVSSEQEIQDWKKNISINSSPEQMKSATTTLINLLKSRLDTIQTQYKSAMGHPIDFTFLTPHSLEILQKMGFDPADLDTSSSDAGAPLNPNLTGSSKDQSRLSTDPDLDALLKKYGT